MKRKEFLQSIAELAETLRQTIEAECLGFDPDPIESAKRRKLVCDPVTGYRYFVKNYFPHYIKNSAESELHKFLFSALPEVRRSHITEQLAIAAPRGEAKSTLVSQLFVLWCIVTDKTHYALVVMDSIDQASPMLEAIKAELEFNPRIACDFPEISGKGRVWQVYTIVTRNSIKVQVAGSGKKLRGLRHGPYRPDLVVLDDIENDEQVGNPDQRDKLERWLTKAIMPLGEAGGKIDFIYIGTILHYDSVLSRTLLNPVWKTAHFKAIIEWPGNMSLWDEWEAIYRNEGEAAAYAFYTANETRMTKGSIVSWAARTLHDLMKIRLRDGHGAFDSEYQNDPVSGEDAPFTNAIQYYHSLPPHLIYFGACDPSLGKSGASRDPSAILIGGFDRENGKLYIIEADIKKRLPDRIIEDVIMYQKQYRCILWSVESVQFQEFLRTELVKRSAKAGAPVPAQAVTPHSDKLLRIESLQPHVNNGLILFSPKHQTLISQLKHFPKADHDDGPDALHMLWTLAVTRSQPYEFTALSSNHKIDMDDDNYSFSRR